VEKKLKIVEPPVESLVDVVSCELVRLELADGYEGVGRLFAGEVGAEKSGAAVDSEDVDSRMRANDIGRGVVYLHGIQSHGGWFLRSCDYLRQNGMTVLAAERRGSGLNEKERGHCGSAKQLIEDTDRCVEWIRDYVRKARGVKSQSTNEEKKAPDPFFKVDIVAVSWSGKLALAYAAQFPQKVRSVVLVTPGLKAKIDISLKDKIVIGAHGIVSPHKLHEIPLNEPKLFTANPEKIKFLENDPLKLTHATASFFVTSKHLDLQVPKLLSRLTMPVYLLLAEHDKIIDNDATINLLRNVLQPIDKSGNLVRIYPGAHHTLDFEPNPQEYFEDLVRILKKS
jgi:acylglycerol lipase